MLILYIIYLCICYITADIFNDSWVFRGFLFEFFLSLLALLPFFVSPQTLSIVPDFPSPLHDIFHNSCVHSLFVAVHLDLKANLFAVDCRELETAISPVALNHPFSHQQTQCRKAII